MYTQSALRWADIRIEIRYCMRLMQNKFNANVHQTIRKFKYFNLTKVYA